MSDHLNQGLKPVLTETAIAAGTYQIFGLNFPCKKQSVFKVAILRMLKFAQAAEYGQKNEVKSHPVTHVMVERFFSSPRCCSYSI